MRDYLTIGTVPTDEDCTYNEPTGAYVTAQRREAALFAQQIARHYPEPDAGYVTVKRFAHDFGGYFEACVVFDDEDEAATTWAYTVEADRLGVLSQWDEQSRAALNFA
jgi:hypothetical protein